MTIRMFAVFSALTALGSACEVLKPVQKEATPPSTVLVPVAVAPVKPARAYHYSPFVVQVPESSMHFTTITFKDVGLKRQSLDPADPVLETIAESVAYTLQSRPELQVRDSIVEYDERLIDPSNHLSCRTHHLYVDVWNTKKRWGYSLWSGCSEADNFAWEEVEMPVEATDLPDRVRPLADDIASSITRAHLTGCYTKSC